MKATTPDDSPYQSSAHRISSLQTPFMSREEVILSHMPLIKLLAYRTAHRLPRYGSPSVDDLVNAGVIGLMDALKKFDPGKKVKFQTYAEYRIKGAIQDELRSQDFLSRFLRYKVKKLEKASEALQKKNGRKAEDEELAEEMGIPLESYYQMFKEANFSSPDVGERRSSPDELANDLSRPEENPFYSVSLAEIKSFLTQGIEKLSTQERMVISLYYYEDLTLHEIAKILGFTESRICQIHKKGLSRLKIKLPISLSEPGTT